MKRKNLLTLLSLAIFASSCATARKAPISVPLETSSLVPRIHFLSASDQWDAAAEGELQQNVRWFSANPKAVVVLEGHCDEWGTDQFNMELGDRRARRIKAHLIAQGIDPDRLIMVVSHGESRPLDSRHTMEAWKQNRRVEFIVR